MTDNVVKREKIIAKIKSLMNVSIERGSSEQEVIKATETVAKLMAEHDLSYENIEEVRAETRFGALVRSCFFAKNIRKADGIIVNAVVKFWKIKHNYERHEQGIDLVLFGEQAQTESANLMLTMILKSMKSETQAHLATLKIAGRGNSKTASTSFAYGFALRIFERLAEIVKQNNVSSTALICLEKELMLTNAYSEYAKNYETLSIRKSAKNQKVNQYSFEAGIKAGDAHSFSTATQIGE